MTKSVAAAAAVVLLAWLAAGPLAAAERTGLTIHTLVKLEEGADVVRTDTIQGEVLAPAALRTLGQWTASYNRTYERLDVIEAVTLKADGRTVPVPPDRIVATDMPAQNGPIFFPDVKLKTIIFQDLAVGDRTRLVLRRTISRPFESFSDVTVAVPWLRFDKATSVVDMPEGAPLQVISRGVDHRMETREGRTVHTLEYRPGSCREPGPLDIDPSDWAPLVAMSEYSDWDAIGRMFFRNAESRSRPTPSVTALAERVAGHLSDPAERLRAVFAYVTREMRYTAVHFGTGGIVPGAADDVLVRRYGDCKDLATLTRAMLLALGIEADYGLIRAGTRAYELPPLPVLAAFDHVVLYIPSLDVWLDATDPLSPPGPIARGLSGRPVLLTGRSGTRVARTPLESDAVERVDSDIDIGTDGTISLKINYTTTGSLARYARSILQAVEARGGEAVGRSLVNQGSRTGTMTVAPGPDSVDYRSDGPKTVTATATLGSKAFRDAVSLPTSLGMAAFPATQLRKAARDESTPPLMCLPGRREDHIRVHLPEGHPLAAVPRDLLVQADGARYAARYRLEGSTLLVERAMDFAPPGPVCDGATLRRLEPVLSAMLRDQNARILQFAGTGPAGDGPEDP